MRNSAIKLILKEIDEQSPKDIFFMTGDLGYSVLEPIAQRLGPRFLNVGIAEANMMSMASALASEGAKVFTYSIAPFTTFRCLEQVRNDVCYHGGDITIIGVGVGYGYGYLGPTHHALEDAGVMSCLPQLNVFSPNDERELSLIFNELWNLKEPKYLRLGKGGEVTVDLPQPRYEDGLFYYGSLKAPKVVFVIGTVLSEVAKSYKKAVIDGEVLVISVVRLKPFPNFVKNDFLILNRDILVIEELSKSAGFSGNIAMQILESKISLNSFRMISAPDHFADKVGSQDFLRKKCGLRSENFPQ